VKTRPLGNQRPSGNPRAPVQHNRPGNLSITHKLSTDDSSQFDVR
jgi:hypothetical protein